MKHLLLVLSILFCISTQAQNISGLYKGTVTNDSTKKTLNYELALSEYRDKITGYAYTTYIVNDSFYYSIKRVSATKKNNELIVEEEKMLVNNFPESRAKKVRQTNIIAINPAEDTATTFTGRWETNRTKDFYPIGGALEMKRDNDSAHSSLIAHLTELKIINTAASAPAQTIAKVKVKNKDGEQKIKVEEKKINNSTTGNNAPKNVATPSAPLVIPYNERKENNAGTFSVTADSVVLSFYDNGVVDGDIISVYVNGKNIIDKSKLLEVATKKTIALNSFEGDIIEMVLVAENLGSIPPNTGLLVVQDGSERYQVRFSADLQTNAKIVFKKRK
jgi:hypothetical protein